MEAERQQSFDEVTQLRATVQYQEQLLQEQQRALAQMAEHVTHLQTSLQAQEHMLNTIYASLGWHIVSRCWRLTDRLFPLGGRKRAIARMVYKFPSLLLPSNLERIAKYIRLSGLVATYKEVRYRLRSESRALFHGVTQIIPVVNKSHALSHAELPNEQVTISVVIPVKNAGENFRPLLTILKNQQGFKDIEIIVVDSGSTDQSLEIAETCGAKIIQIFPEDFSHSYARNLGAEDASGDYLLFMVQDALPPSNMWLHDLFKVTKDNDVVAVSCAEFPREDADLFYRALSWNHYKFLEVDKQDRILSKPESENHLTLRKNGNISDIACLIYRDVFMKYRFRGNYAEDLDIGIRLIRDGYKLAFLGSTRIIHSHNRPAYYHLKRGYVDNLAISGIFPDYPVVAIEAERLFRDLIFLYEVMYAIVCQELQQLTVPCTVGRLSTVVMEKLFAAAKGVYPRVVNVACNGYIDSKFKSFLENVYNRYYSRSENTSPYDGILLDAMQSFTRIIFSYMEEGYELIDDTVLEECKVSLYKAYAFMCGVHLASCFFMGSEDTKKILEGINNELAQEV